ncbi:MAG: phosphonate C-P lyase system protein PhnH [Pseudomonadota bacterium]
MTAQSFQGGFAAPATDAAYAFRALMEAMARPGTIHEVSRAMPPDGLSVAAGVAVLTLCDPDTSVHLAGSTDTQGVREWITFHTGAPFVGAATCDFAVGTWADLGPMDRYKIGTSEYPDRSATLIIEMERLAQDGPTLTGPGIQDSVALSLPETAAFQANHRLFPLGLDFIFTCGTQLCALPRSTEVR